jgi:hypothetical protein
VLPQAMPAGALVTDPEPAPLFTIVRPTGESAKVAVTLVAALIETTQEAVPAQPPLQPAKVEPGAAVAVKVTLLPLGKVAEQVAPQLMPAGALPTVPAPAPVLLTLRVTG